MSEKSGIHTTHGDQNLFSVEHLQRLYAFCEQIQKRKLNVSDIGIPYQWVNNWDNEDLLFKNKRKDGKWRKFNFVDYLWIRIITELRDFGASYDIIRDVKEVVEQEISLDPIHTRTESEAADENGSQGDFSPESLSLLTLLIIETIATKAHIQLLIHSDGECFLLNHNHMHLYGEDLEEFRKSTYLSVSLNHLLVNFIGKHDLEFILPFVPLIREEEAEVLEYIRKEELNKLLIKREDGDEMELVSASNGHKADLELDFVQFVINSPYRFIEFETKDEKIVKFKYKNISPAE